MGEVHLDRAFGQMEPNDRQHKQALRLMDLAHGAVATEFSPGGHSPERAYPKPGTYEHDLFLEPEQVLELFRYTSIGSLLPHPDEPIGILMPSLIGTNAEPWSPYATDCPDAALFRRTIALPREHEELGQWRRGVGVAFQYDHRFRASKRRTSDGRMSGRVVTADFEIGLALDNQKVAVFTKGAILVNGRLVAMEPPKLYEATHKEVDEILTNFTNLVKVPKAGSRNVE